MTAPGLLADCLGSGGGSPGTDPSTCTARASCFVFGDLTAAVAGESAAVERLVPIGHHGHGWEPGPCVRDESPDADLLVHGMHGFQPWVDENRSDLDGDGASVRWVRGQHRRRAVPRYQPR